MLETVVALLRKQTALLVLDNCEHLLDAAAECVRALLRNAPALRVLVTSQEALHTPEEQVYRLGSLPLMAQLDAPAAAVELFVARARAADPRLQLTAANVTAIAEICRRLDGMPLAIELAAARVRLLGIEGLRARLDERFQVLTGGTRATLRRHQTLRAALEWSYGLLSPDEQTVFRRLGRVRRRIHSRVGARRCGRRPDRPLGRAGSARSPGGQITGGRRRRRRAALPAARNHARVCAGETRGRRRDADVCCGVTPKRCSRFCRRSTSSDGQTLPPTRSVLARNWTTCVPRSAGPSLQQAIGRSPAR